MGYRVKLKNLRGGGSCCGEGTDAKILRTYPTILNQSNNVREVVWNSFCDEIDDALKPVRQVKNFAKRMVFLLFAVMFGSVFVAAILISQTNIQEYIGNIWYFFVFSFIFFCPFIIFCSLKGGHLRRMDKVYGKIKEICLNKSNQFSDVNFNLIKIRNTNGKKVWYVRYILVTVAGSENETDDRTDPTGTDISISEDDYFAPSPAGNPSPSSPVGNSVYIHRIERQL